MLCWRVQCAIVNTTVYSQRRIEYAERKLRRKEKDDNGDENPFCSRSIFSFYKKHTRARATPFLNTQSWKSKTEGPAFCSIASF